MNKQVVEDLYPLSSLQEGILIHELLTSGPAVYFEQFYFDMDAGVDIQAFEKALQAVVNRYPISRTAFTWEEVAEPIKVVYRSAKMPFGHYDWRNKVTGNPIEQFNDFLISDRRQSFKFDQSPLVRCTLIRISDEFYRAVFSYHHLIREGWSLPVILKEAFELYDEYCSGSKKILASTMLYRSFDTLHKKWTEPGAEEFWHEYLEVFESKTSISLTQNPGEISNSEEKYEEQTIILSGTVVENLESFSKKHYIPLGILLQGTWALLLSRYRGHNNVVFGTVISSNPRELNENEVMQGFSTTILPLKVNIKEDDFVVPWFKKLIANNVARDKYSYCSIMDIKKWSHVPEHSQLFDNIFIFENDSLNSWLMQIGNSKNINFNSFETMNYFFASSAYQDKEILLKINYPCMVFDKIAITRILNHWGNLLESITEHSEDRISEVWMLSEDESPLDSMDGFIQDHDSKEIDTKQALSGIFSDVLGVEKIGMDENFFMIGGNSLLATQVISRLKEIYNLDLPLEELYEGQTVEEISKKIERVKWVLSDKNDEDIDDECESVEIEFD